MLFAQKEYIILIEDDNKTGYIIGHEKRSKHTASSKYELIAHMKRVWNNITKDRLGE